MCKFLWNEFYGAPRVFAMVYIDFRRRFISLLSYEFHSWSPALALSVLHQPNFTVPLRGLFTGIFVANITFGLCMSEICIGWSLLLLSCITVAMQIKIISFGKAWKFSSINKELCGDSFPSCCSNLHHCGNLSMHLSFCIWKMMDSLVVVDAP